MGSKRITRKEFLKRGGAGLGALALQAVLPGGRREAAAQVRSRNRRPNVLLVVLDQLQSWVDLPRDLPLPAHERLIDEGRAFVDFHVHQAPCAPSRSVIYTGRHVQATGMYTNPPLGHEELAPGAPPPLALPTSLPTLGGLMRDAGYYTAYKGKWHLSALAQDVRAGVAGGTYPDATRALEKYGFSDFNHDGDYIGLTWIGFGHDGFIAADAINLLHDFSEGHTGGAPWFLAVNLINPHDIMLLDTDPEDEAESGPGRFSPRKEPPRIPFYEREWDFPLPPSYYDDDLSTKPPAQRRRVADELDEAGWRAYRDYYFNCIRDADRHVASILDALDRFGLTGETIVVLTADHGELAGAHGMTGKGAEIYKETLRAPLIVRHPDVSGGATTPALASAVDLAPTLLGFAGLDAGRRAELAPELAGVDLGPAVADASARTERDERGVLFDYVTTRGLDADAARGGDSRPRSLIRGVHDGRYKFARYFAVDSHHRPTDWDTLVRHNDLELYDTAADPDEIVNLAHEPERARERLVALNAKTNALVELEIGRDDGSMYPGPTERYLLDE